MEEFQVSKFSNFFLVGINHKTADISVREKFSLNEERAADLIADYKQQGGDGMMVVSTCNRTEIYGFGDCPRNIIGLLCQQAQVSQEEYYRYQSIKQNREAIEHLFRVSAGMESKILGDFEIVGQIKKSFVFAKEQSAHNAFLERLVNSAVQTSKKVKNNTKISSGAASVAFAAVQKIKQELSKFSQPKVVLVGTGKIGKTACENLVNQTGLSDITLINRTEQKAERLANRFGVKHLDYSHLPWALNAADVVIVATGAMVPTVLESHFTTAKSRLVLDLSVPRNVEGSLYRHTDFEVVDVDALSAVAQQSMEKRKAEIPLAEKIIGQMIDDFYLWLESRRVAPTLQAVRSKMENWKGKEVQNILKKYPELNAQHAEVLADQLLNRITGEFAKQLKVGEDINGNLKTIHHIFEL